MARTIAEIQNQIIAEKESHAELDVLNSTSKLSIWRLTTFVTATCIWTLEKLFDIHVDYVDGKLALLKPHTLRWYANKVKEFQWGHELAYEADYYDNTGLSETDIATARIVKHSAANELNKGVLLKLAGESGGDLAPLTAPQLNAVKAYMQLVKDAGNPMYYINDNPDSVKLHFRIYYDPLVLDADGKRLDGTNDTPIAPVIDDYLKTGVLFNGLFILARLVDKLQSINGVVIPDLALAQYKYGLLDWTNIDVQYRPFAGYLRINDPEDLTFEYIAHEGV